MKARRFCAGITGHPRQPLDGGELTLLIKLGAEQLDAKIGEIVLGAQYVDKLGAREGVAGNAGAQQRLSAAVTGCG